jgi:hypothetical protein
MSYRVPEELINRRDVQIFICGLSNTLHIKFSDRYAEVFAKWPKRKVRDLISDIETTLTWGALYRPILPSVLDDVYDKVYVTLRQVY